MTKPVKRVPKNYAGTLPTSRSIRNLLPKVLSNLNHNYKERGDLILQAWPEVIGGRLSKMTRAVSFREAVLRVEVNNSTLLSLLKQHEKDRLLKELKRRFPSSTINDILFMIG